MELFFTLYLLVVRNKRHIPVHFKLGKVLAAESKG